MARTATRAIRGADTSTTGHTSLRRGRSGISRPARYAMAVVDNRADRPEVATMRQVTGPGAQATLNVSTPGDRWEREADSVADRIMRITEPTVQRACAGCEDDALIQRTPDVTGSPVRGMISRAAGSAGRATASPALAANIAGMREGGGRPLPEGIRAYMEPRFDFDFQQVRVHADGRAAAVARDAGARAFTLGSDIVFGAGEYQPGSAAGKRLLAHELTHVVQQSSSSEPVVQRQPRADTHAGYFELTRNDHLGAPTFVGQAQYGVRIEFQPYQIVDCDQIAMSQTLISTVGGAVIHPSGQQGARALTAAQGTAGVSIDRLGGRTSPLYGVNNAGGTAANAHFGSRTGAGRGDRAWITDAPGFPGTTPAASRTAGQTLNQQFETCALCNAGTDEGAYYGCISWGYDIDATDTFTESPFARVSKGSPSADFMAAATNWNAQAVPATTDLPITGHVTNQAHMTMAQLRAQIVTLAATLAALAPGHADIPQVTFELRVLRDIRDAVEYNETQGYLRAVIEQIQVKVGAQPDGEWGYDTVRRIQIWQARNGLTADGRVGPTTLSRMKIHRAGDYPIPDTSETATRFA